MKINEFRVSFPVGEKMFDAWGLEYEGKLWLVPDWLVNKAEGLRKPKRLIRIDTLPHSPGHGGVCLLNLPIPKDVLDGKSLGEYEILEGDEISFAFPYEPPTLQ